MAEISYRRHCFPPVVIQPAVWLYLRFTLSYRKQIADFASTHRLPAIDGFRQFVDAGGLMAYGASLSDMLHRAA